MPTSLCVMDAVITEQQTNNGWKSSGICPIMPPLPGRRPLKTNPAYLKPQTSSAGGCFSRPRVGVNATTPHLQILLHKMAPGWTLVNVTDAASRALCHHNS